LIASSLRPPARRASARRSRSLACLHEGIILSIGSTHGRRRDVSEFLHLTQVEEIDHLIVGHDRREVLLHLKDVLQAC
jgi:hypothetical protein